jgi:hypothetical protein
MNRMGDAGTRGRGDKEHPRDSAIVCLGESRLQPGGNRSGTAAENHPRDSALPEGKVPRFVVPQLRDVAPVGANSGTRREFSAGAQIR